MSVSIPVSSQHKKPFHRRNGSDELDVFEAARYFSGGTENSSATHKNSTGGARNFNYNTRPFGRMSLDMPNHRDNNNPIPLQAMLMENRMMINKEKKSKQPSSPGGKLAHFLNSLFNQTSSKKSKSKTKSTKDEDQSHGGWRRKRRSSMSNFTSRTTTATTSTTTATTNDSKSSFSTSISSGFRTPPPYVSKTPTNTKPYSYIKPSPTQITKIPITGNLNKIETFTFINNLADKKINFHNGYLEKVRNFDEKQEDVKEYKKFLDDDGDSDSSSDLFELTNCDLGYCSSGLPVYETTCMDISIKRGAPISS